MKICSGCGQNLSNESFTILRVAKDGRHNFCRECLRERRKSQSNSTRCRPIKRTKDGKRCSGCNEIKTWEQYSDNNESIDGKQNYCLSCMKIYRDHTIGKKTCEKCDKRKSILHFYEARGTQDGRFKWCKACCDTEGKKRDYSKSDSAHYRDYFSIRDDI